MSVDWNRRPQLCFVTGAPGAGKSAIVSTLLETSDDVLCFDADWLLEPVSALVNKSVWEASETWPAYRALWLRIAQMLVRNGRRVAFFGPTHPDDLIGLLPIPGLDRLAWLLLDCDDGTRVARLQARGWDSKQVEEVLADAQALRGRMPVVDTGRTTPHEAAALVRAWLQKEQRDE